MGQHLPHTLPLPCVLPGRVPPAPGDDCPRGRVPALGVAPRHCHPARATAVSRSGASDGPQQGGPSHTPAAVCPAGLALAIVVTAATGRRAATDGTAGNRAWAPTARTGHVTSARASWRRRVPSTGRGQCPRPGVHTAAFRATTCHQVLVSCSLHFSKFPLFPILWHRLIWYATPRCAGCRHLKEAAVGGLDATPGHKCLSHSELLLSRAQTVRMGCLQCLRSEMPAVLFTQQTGVHYCTKRTSSVTRNRIWLKNRNSRVTGEGLGVGEAKERRQSGPAGDPPPARRAPHCRGRRGAVSTGNRCSVTQRDADGSRLPSGGMCVCVSVHQGLLPRLRCRLHALNAQRLVGTAAGLRTFR